MQLRIMYIMLNDVPGRVVELRQRFVISGLKFFTLDASFERNFKGLPSSVKSLRLWIVFLIPDASLDEDCAARRSLSDSMLLFQICQASSHRQHISSPESNPDAISPARKSIRISAGNSKTKTTGQF